jgi:hypothetical protein
MIYIKTTLKTKINSASFFLLILLITQNAFSASISQCTQPDGTIEFTNMGCGHSQRLKRTKSLTAGSSQSHSKQRKRKALLQANFVYLQKKIVISKTPKETVKYAHKLTKTVITQAQSKHLKVAYNMIAAIYARLSKHLKKQRWEGVSNYKHTIKIKNLFKEILETQSTTSTTNEFEAIINSAWDNYKKGNYKHT